MSVLYRQMARTNLAEGYKPMPPVGVQVADPEALQFVRQWILSRLVVESMTNSSKVLTDINTPGRRTISHPHSESKSETQPHQSTRSGFRARGLQRRWSPVAVTRIGTAEKPETLPEPS